MVMGKVAIHIDWAITVIVLCLSTAGAFLLLTIDPALFRQQLLYIVVGLVLYVLFANIDAEILTWFAPFGYVASLAFLVFPYMFEPIRGASRWVVIGQTQIQPSELAKPFLILSFAYCMTRLSPRKTRILIVHVVTFFLPFALVFRQPDFGTSIIYATVWVFLMIAGGLSLRFLSGVIFTGVLGAPFLWRLLAEYQKDRVLTFLNPALDPRGAGYNAIQSVIAVGSGMVFGRGLGRGTQSHLRFLPEYYTDFIFATLVEELGFIGGAMLLGLYALLLWRLLAPLVTQSVRDMMPYLYSLGVFAMILSQMSINIGMNMGLIPITGITLPLVSYGGSSIVSMSISLGILASFTRRKRKLA